MSNIMRQTGRSTGVVQIPDAPPIVSSDPQEQAAYEQKLREKEAHQNDALQAAYGNVLEKAKEEGDRIAQKMMIHARKERGEILAQAQQEAEDIRKKAYQEGYQAGADAKAADIEKALANLDESVREVKQAQEEFHASMAASVQDFALEVASHLLSYTIEKDPFVLKELVDAALEEVKDTAWVTLEISDQLPELVEALEKEYAKTRPGRARIEVRARELPKDAVLLNTPDGVIDATLSRQLANLRDGFDRQRLQTETK